MAAIFTTAVLAFLAGTITGIVGMYCADSKYIKTIQDAYKEKIRIHRRSERRLHTLLNERQAREATRK